MRGHELAGDAEPALGRRRVEERLLERARARRPVARPFDGRDPDAVHLGGEDEARVDAAVVDQDRAGAALADEAALLRAGQAEVRAEHVEQRVMGFDVERARAR